MDQTTALLTSLAGVAGAPVVAKLVSALVKPFVSDVRFYPLATIGLGIGWNLLVAVGVWEVNHQVPLWVVTIINGVLTGMAATGLWSAAASEVKQAIAGQ